MKAKQEDLDAINQCIEDKWIPLSEGRMHTLVCALCNLDSERVVKAGDNDSCIANCELCIISRSTGSKDCDNTPYTEWRDARRENAYQGISEAAQAAALKEVKFLEALRYSLEIEEG